MKRIIYYATVVFGMSLLLESCNGNSWMEGYWVNEDSSQYLFVKGDEVSMAYPRRENHNYSTVKALFEDYGYTFKLGKAVYFDDISETDYIYDIKIKSVSKESLCEEFPYIEENYSWESAVDELLENDNIKNIELVGIEYRGEIDANFLFSDNKAKKLLFLGEKNYRNYILSSFTKIKPGEALKSNTTTTRNTYSTDSSTQQSSNYTWIVGDWYVTTPYGTTSVQFRGNGEKGRCTYLDDATNVYSAKHGDYYVRGNTLYMDLDGESYLTTIEIQNGNRLHAGGGYYYKKLP